MKALSFQRRLQLTFGGAVLLAALVATAVVPLKLSPGSTFLLAAAAGLIAGWLVLRRELRATTDVLRALRDGISCLEDGDFGFRLAVDRGDELGQMIAGYNRAVGKLRDERAALREQELLLETALQRSPVATILVRAGGRVIYANPEANRLLLGEGKLEGRSFEELLAGCPAELREAMADGGDGLFSVGVQGELETYHVAQRFFSLNQRRHQLILLRRLTSELDRQEARMWKQVIRVVSHELNNSLAPISSLVHSAGVAYDRPEHHSRLPQIFAAIGERTQHLRSFLEGYARFARLPRPKREPVEWRPFLDRIQALYPFELLREPSAAKGFFDPAQIEQVLINLIKNAQEASARVEGAPGVQLQVLIPPQGGTLVQILDRGPGMDAELLRSALLPFFSTKAEGGGVGLPLCREILAEHGGRLAIRNREGGGLAVSCWLPDT